MGLSTSQEGQTTECSFMLGLGSCKVHEHHNPTTTAITRVQTHIPTHQADNHLSHQITVNNKSSKRYLINTQ